MLCNAAPRIYSKALDHFNKNPRETLFIGDSWAHDVVAPMEKWYGSNI
ncbi:HAD hydrolase-like protein [Bacillus sp. V3]|nr:HAD hydrolase-like protein [Bacillus sp. V3]